MLTFLGVAFLVYAGMHFYALGKLWQLLPHSPWLGVTLVACGIALTISPFILWQITRQNWHGASIFISWAVYGWMGFLFLFCCTALALDLMRLLLVLAGMQWQVHASTSLLFSGLITILLMGYGYISARQIQLEEITIITPKLPSSIGRVTIAQISDLHLSVMLGERFLQNVISKLQDIKPDIIVATGDIVDGQGDDFNALSKQFRSLHPPAGLFAVMGNHEYFAGLENSLRFLRNAGFSVLRGDAVTAKGIILAGEDDSIAGRALRQETRLAGREALAAYSKEYFVVLLKHQPLVDPELRFDLQLSGHIHGGQIFPFGLIPWLVYRVHTGITRLDDGRFLYVSRGTGTWGPPLRVFAAPEITLITIQGEHQ